MIQLRRILASTAVLLLVAACAELDVENLNAPDRERALATPGDVETLIAGTYLTYWQVIEGCCGTGTGVVATLSVMADQHTSSWGNFSMRDSSWEPRRPINNDPSYGYAYIVENPWFDLYSVLASLRDGLIAIAGEDGSLETDDDLRIGDNGVDTPRAIAFARYMQGLAHGTLALLYDQAFILDETTNLEEIPWPPPAYGEVSAAALGYLQMAIDASSGNTFTLAASWIPGETVDNSRLVALAHTHMARFMAYTPRTVAERDMVDWNAIITHVDQADRSFAPMGDANEWWKDYAWIIAWPGWARVDLRFIGAGDQKGPGDPNGSWYDWENTIPGDRRPFDIDADDARFPTYPPEMVDDEWECAGQDVRTARCGLYMEYRNPMAPFRPERGMYHFSGYAAAWPYFLDDLLIQDDIGPMVELVPAEMDMLKAEALIRLGRDAEAVPLINLTREANGQLPPVDVNGAPEVNGRCTPRMIDPYPTGTWQCGNLLEAMKWEKRLETYGTGMGIAFFDDRGWGDLLEGTAIHHPMPALELLTLLKDIYTFGGVGMPGGAPDVVPWGEGLAPLRLGDVPSEADLAARIQLFQAIRDARLRARPDGRPSRW